ncbi:MAG TPA: SPOR domain-containing protein [Flavobacterium sp.]|nr:SPOR domain-containing protein [Flavobacterium sp.]
MKIEHHISQLLYRYQCVSVPGFGAFLTEVQPAKLIEDTASFYPPRKAVSFNFHLKNNDGLLASHISHEQKITYEEALKSIEKEVLAWKSALKQNKTVILKNIGQLSLNAEENLVFEPDSSLNYLTQSFGLGTFISPRIAREEYKETAEALEEKAPIAFTSEKRKNPGYLKYAAILVVGLGLSGIFGRSFYISRQQKSADSQAMQEAAVQKKVQDKIQEATFFIENPLPAVTLAIKEEKLNYHVVAGAFRNKSNAEKACRELNSKGYKARKIKQTRHGLYPVIYGSFPTQAAAQKAMEAIQKTENPQAWLLVQEL